MSGRLPEVTIEGPAYERGYQYGRKCRDRIMVSVETYRRMMASYAGLSWDEALRRAHEYELPILLRRARQGKFDLRDIQALLADHAGYPSSICRHPDPEREEIFRLETVCSLLMNLQERKLFVAFGNPCQTPYTEYGI